MAFRHVVEKQLGSQAWRRLWFPFEVTDDVINSGWSSSPSSPQKPAMTGSCMSPQFDCLGPEALTVGDIRGAPPLPSDPSVRNSSVCSTFSRCETGLVE